VIEEKGRKEREEGRREEEGEGGVGRLGCWRGRKKDPDPLQFIRTGEEPVYGQISLKRSKATNKE
jgi:hypothetical protein